MDGRAFLNTSRLLLATPSEENWRSVVGRAYAALLNEVRAALERWGFPVPAGVEAGDWIADCLVKPTVHRDGFQLGFGVEQLKEERDKADGDLTSPLYADQQHARFTHFLAVGLIEIIDQIEADPPRRADIITTIQPVAAKP